MGSSSPQGMFDEGGGQKGQNSESCPLLLNSSDSGVVNLYSAASCLQQESPTPLKVFLNLTTPIDNLLFNHDRCVGQGWRSLELGFLLTDLTDLAYFFLYSNALFFSSRMQKHAVRLAHVQSRTVFRNWPSSGTTIVAALHLIHDLTWLTHPYFLQVSMLATCIRWRFRRTAATWPWATTTAMRSSTDSTTIRSIKGDCREEEEGILGSCLQL